MKKINEVIWTIIVIACGFWSYGTLYGIIIGLVFWRDDPIGQLHCNDFVEYIEFYQESLGVGLLNVLIPLVFVVVGVIMIKKVSTKSEG